jgi:cytochrome c oxidase subunit 2
MRGQVVVMDASDYQQWLEGSGETRPLAERGEWTFQRLSCDRCHAQSDDLQRGPTLLGKFGKPVQLANGQTVTFDEAYVRESILRPREHVVAGYPPIMPTYKGQITESEILGIIDYLKGTNPELLQDSTNTSRDVRL